MKSEQDLAALAKSMGGTVSTAAPAPPPNKAEPGAGGAGVDLAALAKSMGGTVQTLAPAPAPGMTPPAPKPLPRSTGGQRGAPPSPPPVSGPSNLSAEQQAAQARAGRQQQLGIEAPNAMDAFTPEGGWGPVGRSALRTAGAAAGAALAPEAFLPAVAASTLGGASGDALFQIIQHLTGSSEAPQTSEEAARGVGGGAAEGLMQEAGGQFMNKAAPKLLEKSAGWTMRRLLNPGSEAEKAAVSAMAPQFMHELPVAGSQEGLLKKFETGMNTAGQKVEDAYNAIPASNRYRTVGIRNELQKSLDAMHIQGEVPPGPGSKAAKYQELIQWFDQHPRMSMKDLRTNKQLWDEVVNWGRRPGAAEPATEEVYKEGANLIRKGIGQLHPDIHDANVAYDMWATAHGTMQRAVNKEGNKPAMNLMSDVIWPAIAGNLVHGTSGAGAAVAMKWLEKVGETTLWRTASNTTKAAAVRALTSGYPAEYATRVLMGTAAAPLANAMIPAQAGPSVPPPSAPPH